MSGTVLLVPTYGFSRAIRANLSYLAALGGDDLTVVVSDNSENPEKHRFLDGLREANGNVIVHCQEKNIGSFQNFLFLFDCSEAWDIVAYCADDDHISLDYIEHSAQTLREQPAFARSAGKIFLLHSNGQVSLDGEASAAATAPERYREFFNVGSFNGIMYGVARRSAMRGWADFCRHHPLKAAFLDRFGPLSTLASGGILRHTTGHYLWSAKNWDSPDSNLRSRSGFYEDAGLHQNFAIFFELHMAVECVHFCHGEHSPIATQDDRVACAAVLWSRCMDQFRRVVAGNQSAFLTVLRESPKAVESLKWLIDPGRAPGRECIERFADIVDAFNPAIGTHYRNAVLASVDKGGIGA